MPRTTPPPAPPGGGAVLAAPSVPGDDDEATVLAECAAIMQRLLGRCDIDPDLEEDFGSDHESEAVAMRLDSVADEQLSAAYAASSRKGVRTALRHFEQFALTIPSCTLFVRVVNCHDIATANAWNERTLRRFAAHLSSVVSAKTKRRLHGDTIETYTSLVRTAFSVHAGGRVDGDGRRIARQMRGLKRGGEQPVRKLRLPFRAAHFMRCGPLHFGGSEGAGLQRLQEWCVLLFMHHALARVGELGGATLDPRTGLMRSHLIHFPRGAEGNATPFIVAMLRPLKCRPGQYHRVPVVIAQGDGGFADAYKYIALLLERDDVPSHARGSTPAFSPSSAAGLERPHFSPVAVQALLDRVTKLDGLSSDLFKCHSLRIGGATDTAERGGTEAECRLAGRWASDVYAIYARPTLDSRIRISQRLCLVGSVDLESLLVGRGVIYAQPS